MIATGPKRIDVRRLAEMSPREHKAAIFLLRRGEAVLVNQDEDERLPEPILKSRENLGTFVETTSPWKLEDWQWCLTDRLTEIETNKETGVRLAVHAPPQNGKSVITSQRLPAWLIGRTPAARVRLSCYNETHAEAFGEVVLDIMQSEVYRLIFPDPGLALPRNAPKGRFSTEARTLARDAQPSFLAMGLNTGFVGQGAETLIIDDPYKNRDEAFSKIINERIWRFWSVTAKQRISPETNVFVIFHRWARNDLAGRLFDEDDRWEIMQFPAIAHRKYFLTDPTLKLGLRQPGEALTPRRPLAFLQKMRDEDPITFAALQQGDPVPEGGQQFQVDRIHEHDITPFSPSLRLLTLYQGVDLAISLKHTADFTSVATIGVSPDQDIYILDINFERVGFNAALEKIESEAIEWGGDTRLDNTRLKKPYSHQKNEITGIAIEATAYQMSAFEEASRRYMLPFTSVHPTKDKMTRAQLFMRRMAVGKVYVNKNAEWWPELERQLTSFPDETVKDDLIDSIVNAMELLPVFLEETTSPLPAPENSLAELEEEIEEARIASSKTKLN